jgi:hypothetical protein
VATPTPARAGSKAVEKLEAAPPSRPRPSKPARLVRLTLLLLLLLPRGTNAGGTEGYTSGVFADCCADVSAPGASVADCRAPANCTVRGSFDEAC